MLDRDGAKLDASMDAPGATFHLDAPALKRELERETPSNSIVELPYPDGTLQRFRYEASSTLGPDLQRRYPQIQSYRAQGLDDPAATARFGFTGERFYCVILSSHGRVHVRRMTGRMYRSQLVDVVTGIQASCRVQDDATPAIYARQKARPSRGGVLATYRLVAASTAEYTSRAGGPDGAVEDIVEMMEDVNAVYERDLAIVFSIVEILTYTDPDTDGYPTLDADDDLTGVRNANQRNVDRDVGAPNYDIAIAFADQPGIRTHGEAGLSDACRDGDKAKVAVANFTPIVGNKMIIAHELAHMVSATHTYNSRTCPQRHENTAYEPGSGSTVLSSGGCADEESIPGSLDDYFHGVSIEQILGFRDGSCADLTPNGNNPPVVDAGSSHIVPRETPFTLRASGSDPDGDALTYAWEQFDLGASSPPPNVVDGPLFRSFPPTADPSRTFPRFIDLRNPSSHSPWERLPSVDRQLRFRVTVRDNHSGGGQVSWDEVVLTFVGEPFQLSVPNGGEEWEAGSTREVEWHVGGGSIASEVAILFVDEQGRTVNTLVARTSNDGFEEVTVPCPAAGGPQRGRIKIAAVNNIFFDISNATVFIVDTTPPQMVCPRDTLVVSTVAGGVPKDDPVLNSFFAQALATDLCDANPGITSDAPAIFPVGTTHVTFTAEDSQGNTSTCTATVSVIEMVAMNDLDRQRSDELLRVPDPRTGVRSRIGQVGRAFWSVEALALLPDAAGDRMFAVADDRLIELDGSTGEGRTIGAIGYSDVDGLAFHPQTGVLYGVTFGSNRLIRIDPSTGRGRKVAEHVLEGFRPTDLAFHPDGRLFIATAYTPRVWEVDLATGRAVRRWDLSGPGQLESLLWSVDGRTLYSTARRGHFTDLVTINFESATVMPVGHEHSGFEDIEALAWRRNVPRTGGKSNAFATASPGIRSVVLHPNTPNPFNPATHIAFELPAPTEVTVSLFDVTGRRVADLIRGFLDEGAHVITWDGRSSTGALLPSGVYIIRLSAGSVVETRKAVLAR